MKITEFDPGLMLRVTGFMSGRDTGYRARLLSMGLTKGMEFTLVRVAPFGDPVELKLKNGGSISLRKQEAVIIDVEEVKQ
jgi:ferrous iron transport protein A